jgi:hypothetical protein
MLDPRLMPAKYVRPYSREQKNDFRERGVAVRQGSRFLRAELPRILASGCDALSPRMVRVIEELAGDWRRLDERIRAYRVRSRLLRDGMLAVTPGPGGQ